MFLEEEQWVTVDQGSIVIQPSQSDLGLHGQVIRAANCFLVIWLTAGKINPGEKSEYLDHLHRMRHSSVADLQLFHDGLVLDLRRDDSFDIVGRKTTYFVNRYLILLSAMPSEERRGRQGQSQQLVQRCFQCGSTDHLKNQCPKCSVTSY